MQGREREGSFSSHRIRRALAGPMNRDGIYRVLIARQQQLFHVYLRCRRLRCSRKKGARESLVRRDELGNKTKMPKWKINSYSVKLQYRKVIIGLKEFVYSFKGKRTRRRRSRKSVFRYNVVVICFAGIFFLDCTLFGKGWVGEKIRLGI